MPTDPYRFVNGADPIVYRLAEEVQRVTRSFAPQTSIGRGADTSGEHRTKRALDIIIVKLSELNKVKAAGTAKINGDKIANMLVSVAKKYRIRHLIWYGRIYRTRYGTWGTLPGRNSRSSISDWHYDHIHVQFEANAGKEFKFSGNAANTPAYTPASAKTVRPFSINNLWAAIAANPRYYDGNTTTVQAKLKALGYYKGKIDGYFGPETITAYAAFQRAQGYTGNDADGIPGVKSLALLLGPTYYVVKS